MEKKDREAMTFSIMIGCMIAFYKVAFILITLKDFRYPRFGRWFRTMFNYLERGLYLDFSHLAFITLCVIVEIWCAIVYIKRRKRCGPLHKSALRKATEVWEQKVQEYNIDTTVPQVWLPLKGGKESYYAMYIWVDGEDLCMFLGKPTKLTKLCDEFLYSENLKLVRYRLQDIRYYYRTGRKEKYPVTVNTSGGQYLIPMSFVKGGYYVMNTGGARTEWVESDNRRTILLLNNGHSLAFRIDAFEVFQQLIPDKLR